MHPEPGQVRGSGRPCGPQALRPALLCVLAWRQLVTVHLATAGFRLRSSHAACFVSLRFAFWQRLKIDTRLGDLRKQRLAAVHVKKQQCMSTWGV